MVVSVIDEAFETNRRCGRFFRYLIVGLVIGGIVFGILGYYVSRYLAFVEGAITPALIWAIRGLSSVGKDNVGILREASNTLKGANDQAEIEQRIREQIELEGKEKGE